MATLALGKAPARPASRWIIGPGADLVWVIGSSLAGYLYLFLHVALHVPITLLWWFWSIGLDGTHIFGTATRTYFDREERRRHGRLLFGSLLVFFSIGPLLALAGQKGLLAILVGTWAYYHVMRQHDGLLMLYKVKNRDMAERDNRLDRLFLEVMLAAPPFHRFFVHSPEELGLPEGIALENVAGLEAAFWAAVTGVAGAYAARLWRRIRLGEPLNPPKLLLMAAVIPLHWLTFAFLSWQAAAPTVTIVHNLQYHALIWFHNRNKYGGAEGAAGRFGRIPAAAGRSLACYLGLAIAFSALYRAPGFHLGRVSDLAFGLFCGFGLTHYYLDSKIWRVRHDASLRDSLRLA